jgi:hypothetical protein
MHDCYLSIPTIPFLTAVKKCRILNVLIASSGYSRYLLDEFCASPVEKTYLSAGT